MKCQNVVRVEAFRYQGCQGKAVTKTAKPLPSRGQVIQIAVCSNCETQIKVGNK